MQNVFVYLCYLNYSMNYPKSTASSHIIIILCCFNCKTLSNSSVLGFYTAEFIYIASLNSGYRGMFSYYYLGVIPYKAYSAVLISYMYNPVVAAVNYLTPHTRQS